MLYERGEYIIKNKEEEILPYFFAFNSSFCIILFKLFNNYQ